MIGWRRNKYLLKGNSCFLLVNVKNGLKKLDFNRALPTPDKIPVNTGWITRYMNHMTPTNAVNGRSHGNLQRNLNTYHRIRVQKFSDTLQNVSCYKKAKCEFKIEVTRATVSFAKKINLEDGEFQTYSNLL